MLGKSSLELIKYLEVIHHVKATEYQPTLLAFAK